MGTTRFLVATRAVRITWLGVFRAGHRQALMQTSCVNCQRFTPMPFKHSFCAVLDQTKNQSWQVAHGWIVTPTSELALNKGPDVDGGFGRMQRHTPEERPRT